MSHNSQVNILIAFYVFINTLLEYIYTYTFQKSEFENIKKYAYEQFSECKQESKNENKT